MLVALRRSTSMRRTLGMVVVGGLTAANLSSFSKVVPYSRVASPTATAVNQSSGITIQPASELWREAAMARQAGAELAALDLSGVPLLAMTYDPDVTRAAEWRDTGFKHAIPGHVFLDTERAFYSGATQSGVQAFLRLGMWKNIVRLYTDPNRATFGGDSTGEFKYLGGVLVFGPNDTGIVFQQHEQSMGDVLDHAAILEAISTFASN